MSARHVVVTGGGSGIGAATAARLRRDGAKVFTAGHTGEVDLAIDVAQAGAAERIIDGALATMGAIDAVVPCAGVAMGKPVAELDDALWDHVFAVNVTAVFRLVRAALAPLRASGHGRVVTIGSVMSSFGAPGLTAYAASKHAVLGMTRALAAELGPDGIAVTCVQPGAIDTPMTAPAFAADPSYGEFWRVKSPLGRLGKPEDIADVIAFLLSADARFVSGHGIFVDGAAMATP